jgi:phosphatidylglycerophosphate synthase
VDPLADPLAAVLSRSRHVSPNKVTGLAVVFAVSAAACFASGHVRVGGALFLARFFTDCLDGKVARAQGASSSRGAMLDLAADVGGISLVMAALSWQLLDGKEVPTPVPLAFLACLVYYNWALAYRKHLAEQLGVGDGGADHNARVDVPVVGAWVRFCRRMNMSPVPWVLEAEIAVLGVAPLLLPAELVGRVFELGLIFYIMACAVNTRRLWRLTTPPQLDEPARKERHEA